MSAASNMDRLVVSSSLRKSPNWAKLSRILLQSNNGDGSWRESNLEAHDVAIPIPAASADSRRVFRAIFMSPRDVGTAEGARRIEHLYHLSGGRDVSIVFLLKSDGEQQNAAATLMTLQLQLMGRWRLPVIPVDSVAAVPASLLSLRRQMASAVVDMEVMGPVNALLPFCTDDKEQFSKHTVNVITDITFGFRDMLDKLSSEAAFSSEIVHFLGQDAEKLKGFWEDEHLV
ncbi:hypothetical protein GGS20DRAFT_528573, partial [Poronia punctata]